MLNSSYHMLFIVNLMKCPYILISCCSVFLLIFCFSLEIIEKNSNLQFSVSNLPFITKRKIQWLLHFSNSQCLQFDRDYCYTYCIATSFFYRNNLFRFAIMCVYMQFLHQNCNKITRSVKMKHSFIILSTDH